MFRGIIKENVLYWHDVKHITWMMKNSKSAADLLNRPKVKIGSISKRSILSPFLLVFSLGHSEVTSVKYPSELDTKQTSMCSFVWGLGNLSLTDLQGRAWRINSRLISDICATNGYPNGVWKSKAKSKPFKAEMNLTLFPYSFKADISSSYRDQHEKLRRKYLTNWRIS